MISTLILITIIVIVTLKTIMLSLPHLPDDRLRGLLLPRPLSCEELVPDRSKCIDVARPVDEDYQIVMIVTHKVASVMTTINAFAIMKQCKVMLKLE